MKRISLLIILLMLVALPIQAQHLVKPDSLYQTITGANLLQNGDFSLGSAFDWSAFPDDWAVRFGKLHVSKLTTELVTDGGFADSSKWTSTEGFTFAGGKLVATGVLPGKYVMQDIAGLEQGHSYLVAGSAVIDSGSFHLEFGNFKSIVIDDTTTVSEAIVFTGNPIIQLVVDDTLGGNFDDISIFELFDDSSAITNSNIKLTVGKQYVVSYYIDTLSGGNVTLSVGAVACTTQTDTGVKTETITFSGSPEIKVSVEVDTNLVANVDNITIKEYGTNLEDIIDLKSEYGWLSITAIDSGATYTDSVKIYAGLMRTDPVSGTVDTVYSLVSLRNNADYDATASTIISAVNSTSSYFILKPYARLLKIKLENAVSVTNRKWKYILEGHK